MNLALFIYAVIVTIAIFGCFIFTREHGRVKIENDGLRALIASLTRDDRTGNTYKHARDWHSRLLADLFDYLLYITQERLMKDSDRREFERFVWLMHVSFLRNQEKHEQWMYDIIQEDKWVHLNWDVFGYKHDPKRRWHGDYQIIRAARKVPSTQPEAAGSGTT